MVIISIAGPAGSGKSTIGRMLSERLGIPFFSMGDVKRQFALDRGLSILELNKLEETDPTTDHLVDEHQATLPRKHESFIIDSRLGFHFLPQSLKIYVRVDPKVGAQRILDAKRQSEKWHTLEAGIRANKEREESERTRYGQLYGVDHTDLSHYDLILDSTDSNPQRLVDEVLAYLHERGVRLAA